MTQVRAEEFQPMAEINTTPLIDLMLVLLVMFIIIVPSATHKVPVDLPTGPGAIEPPVHRLDLDAAGRVYWDGAPIAPEALGGRLAAFAADPAEPVLHMNADSETRYERFDQTLAEVSRAGITRLGFVNNGRFASAIDRR
ncbi:ExbD/TolR family protein [Allosphingosinicella sp.]|jgi:biopolymer transport protein ExbD|uniref:ExbD/TolR family protein n=1 Tax=Allosphingosinicella sp. TaxID=2823234 RepID=UPI002EE73FD6